MNTPKQPLLVARQITRQFPGVLALSEVDLVIHAGEVVAVIGENGAGKSTLMKILGGVQEPNSGEILLDGKPITLKSVRQAELHGISLIHQELNLADNLNVASNLFLGREPNTFGVINQRKLYGQAKELLDRCGFDLDPRAPVSDLSIGQQQLVEIAKALSLDARILIMDEPTSSLSARESERLFEVIRKLRRDGVAIAYISHRLAEVEMLADRVVGLRDGRNAGELSRDQITRDAMVKLMVGRELSQQFPRSQRQPGDTLLRVTGLRTARFPAHPASLHVRAGEIVGIAGLVGSGRTELLRGIFGIDRPVAGSIDVRGRTLAPGSPVDAIRAGIVLIPEDRKRQGLIIEMSVKNNLSLASINLHQSAGVRSNAYEKELSTEMIARLGIRTPHAQQVVRYLSGGNQQKVVFGKWLALHPKILLMDEPTRGIDVGAKREIYTIMTHLAEQGTAILFVSSELEEVLGMADRTLVMHDGKFTGELSRAEAGEEAVMRLATGQATTVLTTTTT